MVENPIEIISRWIWKPNALSPRIVELRGGSMQERVRQEFIHSSPPNIDPQSNLYKAALRVAEYLGQELPDPEPIDIGGTSPITGVITGLQLLDSRTSENPNRNYLSYFVEYANGHKTESSKEFALEDVPEFIRDLILQIHRETNLVIREWFWGQFGQGERNPDKWKAEKLEVFISYRESGLIIAEGLFDELGIYEKSSTFLPRIDKVDLQAGNWLDQLMGMIDRSPVFVPILTPDYLQGPIARPELDQALRQTLGQQNKRIVPILVEGSPKDYENHFIGGFQMVILKEGLSPNIVKNIAYMCLGISRNPYE